MRPRFLTLLVLVLFVAACSSSSSPAPSAGGSVAPASVAPAGSAEASGSPGASAASDWGQSISGSAVLSGWRSSPEEGEALTQTLLGFPAVYPKIQVDYQPIAGDYRTVM